MCHSLLDQSVVNYAIDEWRRRLSACVDAEGEHLNITYDCYSQNNNVEMAALSGDDFFCSLLL